VIVVDTNVLAYLLIEFINRLAAQVKTGALSAPQAEALLGVAGQQIAEWIEVPHAEVLALAIDRQISAYDARFIACAQRAGLPLVTEDARLRAATPGLSISIAEAVEQVAGD
jgi:predicted nucleic acid-binding protein